MLILHDNDTLSHKTVELLGAKIIPALESPERVTCILKALNDSHHDVQRLSLDHYATEEERSRRVSAILKRHDIGYIEHLRTAHQAWVSAGLVTEEESVLPECFQFSHRAQSQGVLPIKPKDIYALAGYYAFDMSSGLMKDTYISAVASAHLAFCGADMLAQAQATTKKGDSSSVLAVPHFSLDEDKPAHLNTASNEILALCRPPGHHCDTKQAGGYCYINNAVVAAERYLEALPSRHIGILDIDFHHGNGTQEYFYDRSDVMYISIHGQDEYPYYTGTDQETGIGEGEGFNYNYPLPLKSSVDAYMGKLSEALQRMHKFSPEFLIISLGFDTYRLDRLGGFEIDTEDYTSIAHQIRSNLVNIPALMLLEGGYVIEDLGKNLLAFLAGWESVK
jgi:acetoin utilization deacetylase AcuC-like enzyme